MVNSDVGRIDKHAFLVSSQPLSTHTEYRLTSTQGVTGTLFGLSLITATIRMVIRFQSQRRLLFDDFMLMFACLTLSAAQIILYTTTDNWYWAEAFILDPKPQTLAAIEDHGARILTPQQLAFSFLTLTWTSIFAVKICYLLFFHQMIIRLERLVLAWKLVFGFTVICWAFCACEIFISCPHFDLDDLSQLISNGRFCTFRTDPSAARCANGPGFTRHLVLSSTGITLDIVSDLLSEPN